MSSINYLVGPDAPVLAVINEVIADRKAAYLAIDRLVKKHGALSAMVDRCSRRFYGLIFPEENVPKGWRWERTSGVSFCVADKRSQQGKEIAAEMEAMPQGVDGIAFSDRLGKEFGDEFVIFSGSLMMWAEFYQFDETLVLLLPDGCKHKPAGCTELLASEFNQIVDEFKARQREGHKQAEGAKAA